MNLDQTKQRMDGAIDALHREFTGLRTGRASVNLLDNIQVDAYGNASPINQVGTVNAPFETEPPPDKEAIVTAPPPRSSIAPAATDTSAFCGMIYPLPAGGNHLAMSPISTD